MADAIRSTAEQQDHLPALDRAPLSLHQMRQVMRVVAAFYGSVTTLSRDLAELGISEDHPVAMALDEAWDKVLDLGNGLADQVSKAEASSRTDVFARVEALARWDLAVQDNVALTEHVLAWSSH